MRLIIRKGIIAFFLTVTLIMTVVLAYTVYVSFGMAEALSRMDVLVQSMSIIMTSNRTSVQTSLRIHNPSEFTFWAIAFTETFYLENTIVGDEQGHTQYFGGRALLIEPFSNATVSGNVDDIELQGLEPTGNWQLSIEFMFKTPLSNRNRTFPPAQPASVHVTVV